MDLSNDTLDAALAEVEQLKHQLLKQKKINKALMYQIELSMNSQGSAFSSFQAAAILEHKVEERTQELRLARSKLEQSNQELQTLNDELAEKRRLADAANQAKSEFLSSMSHELRTPLNAILGYSEMLMENLADLGLLQDADDAKKIKTSGHHLLSLVNDVLNLSKIEAGKMELYIEPCELMPFFAEVTETVIPLVEKNNNRLSLHYHFTDEIMQTDIMKFRQILFNLLSNAAKFTHEGLIEVDAQFIQPAKTRYLQVVVVDTGIGISETQQKRLFQAFNQADASTTRRYGGTGLGLVLCKHFAEMLGGQISLQSRVNHGSRFEVILPVAQTT